MSPTSQTETETLRQPAEVTDAQVLEQLAALEGARPPGWRLTPRAVVAYLMGDPLEGIALAPKYVGNRRLIETAVATLATDRALLLLGVPGTAKSWVSEHLAAAICGDSQLLIQGTAGTDESQIRYSWNYARLLAEGPSRAALVPTPLMRGMERGQIVRLEELTRIGADVQDTLITILSEKVLPVPELDLSIPARRGFNIIATANNRDRGVNELSSALKRRFNVVTLPLPTSLAEEVGIVASRAASLGAGLALPQAVPPEAEIARIVTLFRELRSGQTLDGKAALKVPSGTLSTAEAISVVVSAWSEAAYFGSGALEARHLAANVIGAVVKDPVQDRIAMQEYLENVMRERDGWEDLYRACRQVL
ncbi:MAG: AAA family ATPase [Neomegalonema sp.]|nr:AAA family ATPase [Neomegalonema sp.]